MNHTQTTIQNKLGLHARASAKVVNLANQYEADVTIATDTLSANAKSIMGLMMLAASFNTPITLSVNDAPDSSKALKAIESLINHKFGESE